MNSLERLGASFRDPSGFLFKRQGELFRQVNKTYREHYDALVEGGLFDDLVKAGLLIPHREVDVDPADPDTAYKIIQPEVVPFISYPYEWSFSQLKDAAMATLRAQKLALEKGFTLKDSSAYNIQFQRGAAVLIDSLSFEKYVPGQPWDAYRQFCQHFLAPLALMAYSDIRLSQLSRVYIDGIPLDLASRLLPWRTRLNFGLLTHIHLHASLQRRATTAQTEPQTAQRQLSQAGLYGLIDSLVGLIRALRWDGGGTAWGDYYEENASHYSQTASSRKMELVRGFLERVQPGTVWDLGANTGVFSRAASQLGAQTVAFDIDPAAVEKNYLEVKKAGEESILPLVLDLTNPSPGLGWNHAERMSLAARGPADAVLALALVHHLAISNNVPLPDLGAFFREVCRWLVIEFVPKEDSQVRILLASRQDIFPGYTQAGFEAAFSRHFHIRDCQTLPGSSRSLYLLEGK